MIALRRFGEVDPVAMRRAAARAWRKNSHGEGRIPDWVVREMVADYERTQSLYVTAERFGRNATTLAVIFKARGLQIRRRGGANHTLTESEVRGRYAVYRQLGSFRAAAAALSVSPAALVKLFRSRGLPVRRPGGDNRRAA